MTDTATRPNGQLRLPAPVDAPVINLDEVMGPRVAVRTVVLGGETFKFGPLSVYAAKLAQEERIEETFAVLIEGEGRSQRFLELAPAQHMQEVLRHIYGASVVGEASPRPDSPSRTAAKSKPSKRTSPRKASASKPS
jgi:hypothetical protein